MKRLNWAFALLLLAFTVPAAAVTDINIFLGQKSLDSADWGAGSEMGAGVSLDEQGEFGILMNFAGYNWPVSIAVDLLGSSDEVDYYDTYYNSYGRVTASTSELDLGVRKVFGIYGTSLHPYVGGGLALVTGTIEDQVFYVGSYDDSDSGTGLWLNGGIFWSIGHFNIGLDARYSEADVTLLSYYGNPVTVNAGGSHAGLIVGYSW
ncbi:MAG TPA: hypothetical protein VGE50_01440 [Gammaproteobacteria bacterium]